MLESPSLRFSYPTAMFHSDFNSNKTCNVVRLYHLVALQRNRNVSNATSSSCIISYLSLVPRGKRNISRLVVRFARYRLYAVFVLGNIFRLPDTWQAHTRLAWFLKEAWQRKEETANLQEESSTLWALVITVVNEESEEALLTNLLPLIKPPNSLI